MKIENESYGLSKTTLTALLFSLLPYSQALAQNIGEEPTLRIIAYQQRPVDTARVTVLPGSATGFMALLRQLGIRNETIVLQVGVALQAALETNFPTHNKVIAPNTELVYIHNTKQIVVVFPDGNTLTAAITGAAEKPQVHITVSKQESKVEDTPDASVTTSFLAPITHNTAPSTRSATPASAPTMQRGTPTPIEATGVGGALKKTILQDYHELPIPSIANQAGLFINNHLAGIVGDTLPNNLFIQTVRDNQIAGLRVSVIQKTTKVEKTETGSFKTTGSGKKIPIYKTTKTPIFTKIAAYGITCEGTRVTTYVTPITD